MKMIYDGRPDLDWAMKKIKYKHRDLYNTILYSPDRVKDWINMKVGVQEFSFLGKLFVSDKKLFELVRYSYLDTRDQYPYLVVPEVAPNLTAISVRPSSDHFYSFSGDIPQKTGSVNALKALSKCFVIPFVPRIGNVVGYMTDNEATKKEFLNSFNDHNRVLLLKSEDFTICDATYWMQRLKSVDPVTYETMRRYCFGDDPRIEAGGRLRWPFWLSSIIGLLLGAPLRARKYEMRLSRYQLKILADFEEQVRTHMCYPFPWNE